MTPEKPSRPEELPAEPPPISETPGFQTMLERYRLQSRERRQRRQRHLLVAIRVLLGSSAVLVVLLSIAPVWQRREPSPRPAPLTPSVTLPAETDERRPEPRASERTASPERSRVASPSAPPPALASSPSPAVTVGYQPRERLGAIEPGEAKEHVFEVLGGTVERRDGALVRIDGIRLRASGRSADHPRVEVADVEVAENTASVRYWFLFANGHLLAWGRPEEWPAVVARYQIEIDYR